MPEIVAPISRTYAAGDDLSLTFTVTDRNGAIVDLAGYTYVPGVTTATVNSP